MNETNDCYPSAFKLSLRVVDIDIDDVNKVKCDSINSSGDDFMSIEDDKDDTDMEEEIWRSRYGYSGLCLKISFVRKEGSSRIVITILMKLL